MRLIQLVLIAAIGYGAYNYLSGKDAQKKSANSSLTGASTEASHSSNGFIDMPTPQGFDAKSVIVFAPPNCPEAAGQRADEMMRRLTQAGIPAVRASSANFSGSNITPETVGHLNSVMAGELPAVFVLGTGKANPSVEETLAQYSRLVR
ncbi:hypothetical protein [Variovorax sp. PCZ-1]|uniref:hypothetical protein n=1 Tax=Variovorax sp. PCZ-1 TaxID=2835533 RepID=UPI001BCB7CDA|nr:hypothetical protein [Variovorax sp. PCZ-1]MBS7806197.1 hypothetical protein [Variovorax sp. PCZ-1]